KPKHPHTGLGYIEQGKKNSGGLFEVSSFTEKPDHETAKKFLATGKFLWNTGYFVCRADTLLELYRLHQPEIYNLLLKIKPFTGKTGGQKHINRLYSQMPKADIEKGLVEK